MIFGFGCAIVAGFLLTSVRNWTNLETLTGHPLLALLLLWLAGRVLPLVGVLPDSLVALVDLSFLPMLALSLAVPIIRAKNYRNLVIIALLVILSIANLLVHLSIASVISISGFLGVYLALAIIVMMITLIGGRVIPFFTERATASKAVSYPIIEKLVLPLGLLWALAFSLQHTELLLITSVACTLVHTIRLKGWFTPKLLKNPLLWVLHAGYLSLVVGFLTISLATLGLISQSIAIHAFAVGGIGLMTLGMMSRVSLGHTGRPLKLAPLVNVAFYMMLASLVLRMLMPWLPFDYSTSLVITGAVWIAAWGLFVVHYFPILIRPRADQFAD